MYLIRDLYLHIIAFIEDLQHSIQVMQNRQNVQILENYILQGTSNLYYTIRDFANFINCNVGTYNLSGSEIRNIKQTVNYILNMEEQLHQMEEQYII